MKVATPHFCAMVALASFAATMLWGQTSAGQVVVTAQDGSGAAIVDAEVVLRDESTGATQTQSTGSDGFARFVSVRPSSYTVEISREGFKRNSRQNVVVNVAQSVSLDLVLELGSVSETVEVVGAAPLLQTERGELGQVIGTKQVVDLPLNGRNPIALAGLTAGVVPGPSFNDSPLQLANLNVNGSRGGATEILQDGAPSTVPENSPGTYATATLPSVERVLEFKVQTSSFSAEFGRTTGGVINVVVKSGTNTYHGSAYEFLRNSRLDANDWFQNRAGRDLGTFQRNQFGFTFGGPVIIPGVYNGKNRTFVFGGYEGLRERRQQTSTITVPTAAELRGDFSSTRNAAGQPVIIYDPLTTVRNADGTWTRRPFPNNIIPSDRIDPVAARTLQLYPTPNVPGQGPANLNNYIAAGAGAVNDDNFDVRVDQVITANQWIYGRLSRRDYRQVNPNFYGTIGQPGPRTIPRPGWSSAINYSNTLRPSLLAETTLGFARLLTNRQSHSFGVDVNEQIGMPDYLVAISDKRGLPTLGITGYGGLGESFNADFSLESYTLQQNLTLIQSRHSVKFGGQIRVNRTNFFQGQNPAGQFTFNPGFTQGPDPTRASTTGGNSVASLLLGYAASGSLTHDAHISTQSPYYALFIQDDFKVNRSLTLNFGLRYELEIPRTERYDRLSVFNPEAPSPLAGRVPGLPNLSGALEFVGVDRDSQYSTDWNNFGPRFGFAWRVPGELVLRGGYAMFYSASSVTAAGTLGGGGNAGFASRTLFQGSVDGGLTPSDRYSNPFPRGFTLPPGSSLGPSSFLGLEFQTPNQYDRTPYMQQWNFNIQKELVPGLLLETGYAGSMGHHLPNVFGTLNQLRPEALALGSALLDQVPNPFFGIITDPTSLLSRATVSRGQLLRPYPQYGAIMVEKAAIGNSNYHALQVRVDRRFNKGVSFLAAYTWSKSIDDTSTSGTGLTGPYAYMQNYHNRQAERSLSVYDVTHRLVMSGTFELPFGRGKAVGSNMPGALDAILGGWQLNGIATFASGFPLILTSSVNTSNSMGEMFGAGAPGNGVQRPNNIGRSAKLSGPVVDRLTRYFDTTVFTQPPPFTFGNTPRTLPDVRSPSAKNLDLSLFKNFRLGESLLLQFRAEAFNATNTPIFGNPGTVFGTQAFGVINSQGNSPRQVQLALRLAF
jgi:hypothetical protein